MVGRLGIVLVASLLLVVVPPLVANTPIPAHGDVIVFADKAGGNEWWVEAVLSGGASGSVAAVDSMDTGGPWVAMTHHAEWGSWAASYHVEAGHQVRFRASWAGGEQAVSCWFTHPAGVEQQPCGGSTTSTSTTTTTTSSTTTSSPPPSGCFAATFTIKAPNQWWQELYPSAPGHTVASAQVRVNSGGWQSMSHSSWGAWTSSVHSVAGSKVEFRITDPVGGTSQSLPFTWLDGSLAKGSVACGTSSSSTTSSSSSSSTTTTPPPPPPPPGGVTFSSVKGNPWWVEAVVKSTSRVDGVWVVFDCDPNRDPSDMSYHADWGKWALGLGGNGIPAGTRVSFMAFGDFNGFARSQNYVWPNATPTAACPADVTTWPVNGSTAEYHLHTHTFGRSDIANLHLRYVVPAAPYSPGWEGTCDGSTTVTNPDDGTQTTTNWTAQAPVNPPVETRLPRIGFHIGQATANQPSIPAAYTSNPGQACFPDDGMDWNSTATGTVTKQMALVDGNGQPRTMTVWHAEGDGGGPVIEWETQVGLVLHWSTSDLNGFTIGDLERTDAPV